MHLKLIRHINKYVSLTESDIAHINESCSVIVLRNKEHLLEEGQVCRYIYFVLKGCLRMYFYTEKGSEQIVQFAIENWWITDYFGYMQHTPSNYNIQAVGKSEVLAIEYSAYNELLGKVPSLERYFRIMAQMALGASQFRMKLARDLSKEDLYLHFKEAFPAFVQQVPQYMIASYLGLTPEYLSELRKKNS